jgi:1,4-dihydroxy-2-naphthoate octaprenyltransferase
LPVSRKRIWIDLLLYPAHTLPTAAAPVLVGAGLAAHDRVFAAGPVLIAFLGSWLIHVAGVFTDNHELLRRYPGIKEHPDLSAALEEKSLTLLELKLAIATCLMLALPAAAIFLHVAGPSAIAIGVIGLVASLGYAGGPIPYTKLGIAEPVFFAMFGVVAVAGTYYAQIAWLGATTSQVTVGVRALPLAAYIVGLPVGALVTNVLLIDDMRDREFDAVKAWRTLAVRSGIRGSRIVHSTLTAFAYLAPLGFPAAFDLRPFALLPLLTLPWAWQIKRTIQTYDDPGQLVPMTRSASLLACAYAGLSGIGLALA